MIGDLVANWGSTEAERRLAFPCDRHLPDANQALFRAVDVAAPPALVFRWLCQLKLAPYSYDWIDNLGRQSPRQLTSGVERLTIGERVMTIFTLVDFAEGKHLTGVARNRVFGTIAASYVVRHVASEHCRIVVKLLIRYPTGVLGCLQRAVLPLGDLIMMRKQLHTLKALAERDAAVLRSTRAAV